MTDSTATSDKSGKPPVFYTRKEHRGTSIALWANDAPAAPGKEPAQFSGKLGTLNVQLWEAKSERGAFFNIKTTDAERKLVQIGTANAYINDRGFNNLSISMRFDTAEAANEAKTSMGLAETEKVKSNEKNGVTSYFINLYADVSVMAIKDNPARFADLGFDTNLEKKRPAASM